MKHKPQSEPCKHVGLAHSAVGTIAVCPDCGVIHLSLHYLSLRFEPEAFRELTNMLAAAQMRLDRFKQTRGIAALPESENCSDCNLH